MKVIGIAGTAKNTGKTTTTAALLELSIKKGLKTALTSIGYDGEELDNVTGLPKPRYRLNPGVTVAIAEGCIKGSTAEIQIIEKTDIKTALGKIIIGKIIKAGSVVIAGPNKSKELKEVIKTVNKTGAEIFFVDGALNRIAPMVETRGIIIATGASKKRDISELADETRCLEQVFEIPPLTSDVLKDLNLFSIPRFSELKSVTVFYNNNNLSIAGLTSILNEEVLKPIYSIPANVIKAVYIPGIIKPRLLFKLVTNKTLKTVIFKDPIKMVISGDPCDIIKTVGKLHSRNINVLVVNPIKILAVTINPFYPLYRNENRSFTPAFVDKVELKRQMSDRVSSLVVNIMDEGASDVLTKILRL